MAEHMKDEGGTPEGIPLNSNSNVAIRISAKPEEMPLNSNSNVAIRISLPSVSVEVDTNATTQMTQPIRNNPTPPPLYYNINLAPDRASIPGISDRGAPPSYEQAINPNAPPPSYELLFGHLRKGILDFLQNMCVLFLGTIGCTILIGITISIPLSMVIMGGLYLYDCPQGEYIPVYLLVGGVFGVFKQLLNLAARIRQQQQQQLIWPEEQRGSSTEFLIGCFIVGWFIIGSMWVYKEYEPNYDPALGKYCNKTLYLYAFWLITIHYILLACSIAAICFFTLMHVLCE